MPEPIVAVIVEPRYRGARALRCDGVDRAACHRSAVEALRRDGLQFSRSWQYARDDETVVEGYVEPIPVGSCERCGESLGDPEPNRAGGVIYPSCGGCFGGWD